MKRSLRVFFFFQLMILLFSTSCKKEEAPIDVKAELQGEWRIDKVRYRCGGTVADSTVNYKDDRITFDGNEITMHVCNMQDYYRGTFIAYHEVIRIEEEPDPFCDDYDDDPFNDCECEVTTETKRYMNANLKSVYSLQSKTLCWHDFEYNKCGIVYTETRNGGKYTYTLKR